MSDTGGVGTSSVADYQRAIARVCFDRTPSEVDLAFLGADFRLYRNMVRNRMRDLLATALPRTEAAIGNEEMTRLFADMLAESPPASRYFRELVVDFARYARERATLAVPHGLDSLYLEATQWELNWRAAPSVGEVSAFSIEKIPVVHPTLRVLDLGYSVHRSDAPIQSGSFHVAIHRRPDSKVETRTLTDTSARLVREWMRGESTAIDGVRAVLAFEGRQPDAPFLEMMSSLLSVLVERGAILGSR